MQKSSQSDYRGSCGSTLSNTHKLMMRTMHHLQHLVKRTLASITPRTVSNRTRAPRIPRLNPSDQSRAPTHPHTSNVSASHTHNTHSDDDDLRCATQRSEQAMQCRDPSSSRVARCLREMFVISVFADEHRKFAQEARSIGAVRSGHNGALNSARGR